MKPNYSIFYMISSFDRFMQCVNYKATNEIAFFGYKTKEECDRLPYSVVAIFKVKMKDIN